MNLSNYADPPESILNGVAQANAAFANALESHGIKASDEMHNLADRVEPAAVQYYQSLEARRAQDYAKDDPVSHAITSTIDKALSIPIVQAALMVLPGVLGKGLAPAAETVETLLKANRLAVVFQQLSASPPAATAEEAMAQMNTTLERVADAYSQVPKDPNPPRTATRRMYPPQKESILAGEDGTLTAISAGHVIICGPEGSITVIERATGSIVFQKAGGG